MRDNTGQEDSLDRVRKFLSETDLPGVGYWREIPLPSYARPDDTFTASTPVEQPVTLTGGNGNFVGPQPPLTARVLCAFLLYELREGT